MKCLIKSLSSILLGCLFAVSLRSSVYTLDPGPLVDICNGAVFHSVACFFTSVASLAEKTWLTLMMSNVSFVFILYSLCPG